MQGASRWQGYVCFCREYSSLRPENSSLGPEGSSFRLKSRSLFCLQSSCLASPFSAHIGIIKPLGKADFGFGSRMRRMIEGSQETKLAIKKVDWNGKLHAQINDAEDKEGKPLDVLPHV